MLEHANPLVKVTIVPRGKALGAAWYLPEERQITTREQLQDEMCATLGGRAAEELVLGKISTGASNDLERVTKQAYAMVVYFGMSDKLPNLNYYDSTGQDWGFTKPYSEETAKLSIRKYRRSSMSNTTGQNGYYPRIRKDIVNLRRYYWIVR